MSHDRIRRSPSSPTSARAAADGPRVARLAVAPAPRPGLLHGGRAVIRRLSVGGKTISTGMYASDLMTRFFPSASFTDVKKALDGAADRPFKDEAELVEWLKTVLPAAPVTTATATTSAPAKTAAPPTTAGPAPKTGAAAEATSWRGAGARTPAPQGPAHQKLAQQGKTISVGTVTVGSKQVNAFGTGGRWDEHVSKDQCLEYLRTYAAELTVGKGQKLAVGEGRTKRNPLYGQILYDFDGSTIRFWHAHDKGKMG